MATLTGSSADGTDNGGHTLEVLATNGGKIDLSNATRIIDPAEGAAGGRRFVVRALGSGSLIDLSRLVELRHHQRLHLLRRRPLLHRGDRRRRGPRPPADESRQHGLKY